MSSAFTHGNETVDSLPDRPLTRAEGERLRESGRVLDLTYSFDVEEEARLISLVVDAGTERHLLAFHPDESAWTTVWSGSDESDGDPFEVADEWARAVYGWPAERLFNLPGGQVE